MEQATEPKLDAKMMEQITNFIIDRLRKEEAVASKERYNKKKANTKLLLRNYRSLVGHCENATYTAQHVGIDDGLSLAEILEYINGNVSDRLKIESIQQSVIKTKIILEHVDNMIDLYKIFCERSTKKEDMRRYRVTQTSQLTKRANKMHNQYIDRKFKKMLRKCRNRI